MHSAVRTSRFKNLQNKFCANFFLAAELNPIEFLSCDGENQSVFPVTAGSTTNQENQKYPFSRDKRASKRKVGGRGEMRKQEILVHLGK
jgi:hypothetical protein